MREIALDLDRVRLRALAWGPDTGPLAVLLHGFPDTAHTWRHLGPALAAAGWRVVAPFTRGYAPSTVPLDGSSHVAALVDDAVAVHALAGGGPDAALIGHDWGAITANSLAAHPDNPFGAIVSMAVPPLSTLRGAAALPILPRQLRNSWYILFNQLPYLPERCAERLTARLWADWSPGYDARADLAAVRDAMTGPEHRSAILDYYRHLARPFPRVPHRYRRWTGAEMDPPRMPLLYLHGADDGCLDPRLAAMAAPALPAGSRAHVVDGAGHFLHLERPDLVNAQVLAHLDGH